jgi:hypothetical protein
LDRNGAREVKTKQRGDEAAPEQAAMGAMATAHTQEDVKTERDCAHTRRRRRN